MCLPDVFEPTRIEPAFGRCNDPFVLPRRYDAQHFGIFLDVEYSNYVIRAAKQQGLRVSCDAAAYQLLWDDTALSTFDTNYKVNPPLREADDRQALLAGLRDGTIDAITTNHSPQDQESKKLEFDLADFGMTGLEMLLPMLLSLGQDLTPETWISKVTSTPRQLLGQEVNGLEIGALANLTLFSPSETWTYQANTCYSKGHNHPWFGQAVTGQVKATVYGKQVYTHESLMHGA